MKLFKTEPAGYPGSDPAPACSRLSGGRGRSRTWGPRWCPRECSRLTQLTIINILLIILTCVVRVDILHLHHPLCPEHLQPLVVAVVSKPGDVDTGQAARGEGQGDQDVVVVVDGSDLWDETVCRGVNLGAGQ